MSYRESLAYLARLTGVFIGSFKFNTLRMGCADGRRTVWKRRRRYAPMLTVAANLYCRMLGLPIRVLINREWLQREQELYRQLYQEEVTLHPHGWLEVPWHGDDLAHWLINPVSSVEAKMQALTSATLDLHRAHAILVGENGAMRRFSHGDACVSNVAYSPEDGKAHWFDFETVHGQSEPSAVCHADDVRALLFSALSCLPDSLYDEAIRTILDAYPDKAVWQALQERVASGGLDFDTYHLAQAKMNPRVHRHVMELLLRQLDSRVLR